DISENDESNIEAPSPATPVKSPEKPVATDSPTSIPVATKKDPAPTEAVSQPSTPPSPAATPQEVVPGMPASPAGTQQDKGQQVAVPGATAAATQQQVVKPGVLRYTPTQGQPQQQDEYGIGVFSPPQGKPQVTGAPPLGPVAVGVGLGGPGVRVNPLQEQPVLLSDQPSPQQPPPPVSFAGQLPQSQGGPVPPQQQQFAQPPSIIIPGGGTTLQQPPPVSPHPPQSPKVLPQSPQSAQQQFKVKPASALMPDDKKSQQQQQQQISNKGQPQSPFAKKKARKSPAGSPNPALAPTDQPLYGSDQPAGREEVTFEICSYHHRTKIAINEMR
ncbi:unnamed protein product, partial [Acanthoscelides obtectus]